MLVLRTRSTVEGLSVRYSAMVIVRLNSRTGDGTVTSPGHSTSSSASCIVAQGVVKPIAARELFLLQRLQQLLFQVLQLVRLALPVQRIRGSYADKTAPSTLLLRLHVRL